MGALRWVLAGAGKRPVALRNAQRWVARMREVGMVEWGRPNFAEGSVVWVSSAMGGRAQNIYRQTVRHDVAVAFVSARYVNMGWQWQSDFQDSASVHRADGIAVSPEGAVELLEVELTRKTPRRYAQILPSHAERIERGEVTQVRYLGVAEAVRGAAESADQNLLSALRARFTFRETFDVRGSWVLPDEEVRAWFG